MSDDFSPVPRIALASAASWTLAAALAGCGGASAASPAAPVAPVAHAGPVSTAPVAPVAAAAPLSVEQAVALLAPLPGGPSMHDLLKNSTFDSPKSLPWMASFTRPAAGSVGVEGGALCVDVGNPGANAWDAQVRHREMTLQKGHRYTVRFKISATSPTTVLAKIGMSGPPYKAYWQQQIELDRDAKAVEDQFTMTADDDATAEFAFHLGGRAAAKQSPFDVCVDDVVLEDPTFTPRPEPAPPPIPNVLVNQVGYAPALAKIAVLKSDATAPLAWQLVDEHGRVVSSGTTVVHGADAASGDPVHVIDFSAFRGTGRGFTLRVGADASHAFSIDPAVYSRLKYDALHYFYHSRSGIPIEMPYAGDPKWTRPAGHPGDKSVACAPDAHCDYTLDVSGGWYDAGDQGKYVVSGAVATWTLLDLYERTRSLGTSIADFGDGKLNIPERHNGAPDLLDEARWELEFMLKMQVPEGKPLAGMVHHKIHDRAWTALATRPDQDPEVRLLRPVSTAATLDLAAVAAQCARVYKSIDPPFAARCLTSAERAWKAAVANPALYITAADTIGGGPYEDADVSDEFYWAAAELSVTTDDATYRDFMAKSPHHSSCPAVLPSGDATAMTWQNVEAMGTISIAVAPSKLPKEEVASARAAIERAADAFVATDREQGYRVGFAPDRSGHYPWGSNSFVLDNAVVLALAYDFTHDDKYLGAVEDALGYVLGRNPLDQSYVTGYGARPLEHPHHRFWAHQANAAFPSAPPGVMSGGPNSGLQDPYVQAAGLRGCPPMKCYVDNIEAYSANEEAINWNAPLAWVAAFLDERAKAPPRVAGRDARTVATTSHAAPDAGRDARQGGAR